MVGLLQHMKDLYIGSPRGKVRRIGPRNWLTAVPKIFFFCESILPQIFLSSNNSPQIFFASSRAGIWWGFCVTNEQGVIQDLEYAMRTKVSSYAEPSHDNPTNPKNENIVLVDLLSCCCCWWWCRAVWPERRITSFGFSIPFQVRPSSFSQELAALWVGLQVWSRPRFLLPSLDDIW